MLDKPKSRKRRDEDFGLKSSTGVNYNVIHDRHVDDMRFERQLKAKKQMTHSQTTTTSNDSSQAPSATMDAFMRMVTGKEERTIADKISDPNRPTWEEYKKVNADKLRLGGVGEKEMIAYRKELDAAREKTLSKRREGSKQKLSDSSDSDSSKKKRSKKKKKKRKRKHKRKSYDSDSEDSAPSSKKKKKLHKKSNQESSPVRLSSFFNQEHSNSDE